MSYGSIIRDLGYRGAGQADKILKGVKPVDVPIDQATTFELVLRVARANRTVSGSGYTYNASGWKLPMEASAPGNSSNVVTPMVYS
jgi:hypothetical protein